MKNQLFIAFIAVSLFMACSRQDEPGDAANDLPQGDAISFITATENEDAEARAVVSDFAVGDKLGILAYQLNTEGDWNAAVKPDFMYNVPIEKTDAGFDYSPQKYYPYDGSKIQFFAYYPYSGTAGANGITVSQADATGYPTLTFEASGDYQQDLLAAVTEPQNTGSVYLKCDHLLGKINFSLKAAAEYAGNSVSVKVTSLRIAGVKNKGKFSFDSYTNSPTDKTSWWSVEASVSPEFEIGVNKPVDHSIYANLLTEPLLLIPQTTNLTITVNATATVVGIPITLTPQTFTINDATWTAGKSVNYTIDLAYETLDDAGGEAPPDLP